MFSFISFSLPYSMCVIVWLFYIIFSMKNSKNRVHFFIEREKGAKAGLPKSLSMARYFINLFSLELLPEFFFLLLLSSQHRLVHSRNERRLRYAINLLEKNKFPKGREAKKRTDDNLFIDW